MRGERQKDIRIHSYYSAPRMNNEKEWHSSLKAYIQYAWDRRKK